MPYRLTKLADRDIVHILRETRRAFGPHQVMVYTSVIDKAIRMIAEDPDRPSSQVRTELGPGVRSFHLEIAVGRRGGASHMLYFTQRTLPDGSHEVIILRVLHESMEPRRRVVRSLAPHETGKPESQ